MQQRVDNLSIERDTRENLTIYVERPVRQEVINGFFICSLCIVHLILLELHNEQCTKQF